MNMTTEYAASWVYRPDGIYKAIFPQNLTFAFIIADMTSVINDYVAKNSKDIHIRVLADASAVKTCGENVLLTLDHAIKEYPKSKVAIYNSSEEFKSILATHYKSHEKLNNISNFETENEAISWLLLPQ